MAHLNNEDQSSDLARIIIEHNGLHKPQMALFEKKMGNSTLTVTYLNDKNKSPTSTKASKSNQEDNNHDVILIEDEFSKEIESNNDGQVNKNKKKTEKNKDQNISDIQENNKKQIFFPHNEQINEYGLLESRKRIEHFDNGQLNRKKKKTEKNENNQKKSNSHENNNKQILTQRDVDINNDYRFLQPRNNALTVTCLNGKNKSPTLDKASVSNRETEDHVILIEDEYSSTTNYMEYQRLESCDMRINQVENGKCLKIEEHNVPLSIKIIESDDLHYYKCLICQKSFPEITDFEDHSKKSYTCDICYVTFCTLKDLKCHNKLHKATKSFNCQICKLKFTTESSLDKHLKDSHIETVVRNPNMISHVQTNDTSVKRDICKSSFEQKSPLKSHGCLKPHQVYERNIYKQELNQESDVKFDEDINSEVEMPSNCQVTPLYQESLLESNKNVLDDKNSFECKTCYRCFSKKSLLVRHEKTHIDIKYQCPSCEEVFNKKSDLICHMEYHSSKAESCPTCNQVFNDQTQYQSHKCLTPDETNQYKVYGEEFNKESDLKLHTSLHKDVNSKIEMSSNCQVTPLHQESLLESNKNVLGDKNSFECKTCYRCFSKKSLLVRHEKTHIDIKYQCPSCEEVFNKKSDLICHMEYHSSKAESCPTYNQVFYDQTQYQSHKCLTPDKTNQYKVYGEEFNKESDSKLHASLHKDVNSKIEMPPNCQVTPLHQESLLESNKNVLDDEKPFLCEICNECFSTKSLLIRHETTHTDIKYQCPSCEEVFNKKSDLICHMEYHSSKADSCPTCNQVFNDKTQFQSHKCLTPGETNQCKVYGKEFNKESDSKLHASLHKDINSKIEMPPNCQVTPLHLESPLKSNKNVPGDEKPFICETCFECFSKKSLLVRHKKTHINMKYACYYCQQIFYKKSDLFCHMKYHSSKVENCSICNQVLNDKTQFQSHKCLTPDETYQCIVCGDEFQYKSDAKLLMGLFKDLNSKIEPIPNFRAISLHQEPLLESDKSVLSDEKLFIYGLCNQCSCKKLLIGQEKSHVDIKYKHEVLEKEFYQKLGSIFHMISHPFKTSESYLTWNQVFNEKLLFQFHKYLKLEKIYQCSDCDEEFKHESDAKFHLSLHKDINSKIEMDPDCQETSSDQESLLNLKNSVSSYDEKTFKCEFCNKLFPRESLLVWHETSHTDIKKYYCQHCDEVFYKKSDLIFHMKSHFPKTIESCPICYQEFKNKSFLDKHIKTIHIKVNLFTCNLCNANVYSKSRLLDHLMAHTQKSIHKYSLSSVISHVETNIFEESFQCEACNMNFELKTPFDFHMKYHHVDNLYPCNFTKAHQDENLFEKSKTTEENSLECHICKKLFTHKENLLKHSEKHKNGNDNISIKPYLSQMYSINYESKISPSSQYQCDICKSFIFKKRKLIHHMKKHLKKRTNFCNLCGIKYTYNFSLKPLENKNPMKCSICTILF